MHRLAISLVLLACASAASAQPDLNGRNALFPAPDRVQPGGAFSISYTFANTGTEPAPDFEVGYYLSRGDRDRSDDDLFLSREVLPGMGVQMNSSGGETLTVPASTPCGGYYVLAIADDRDLIAERDETNNRNSGGLTVCGENSSPDLLATNAEQEDETAAPGDRVSVEFELLNQGGSDAGAFVLRYYLRALNAPRDEWVFLEEEAVGGVEQGEREDESDQLTIPEGTAPGEYAILVVVDEPNVIVERNEVNNVTGFGIFDVVTGTAAGDVPAAAAALSVAPNPARGAATLRFSLPTAQAARVSVHDVLGREVAVLADGAQRAGEQTLGLDTSGWAPGVYVVRLATADGVQTARLTVGR